MASRDTSGGSDPGDEQGREKVFWGTDTRIVSSHGKKMQRENRDPGWPIG
jgi:hypothetical protein